MAKPSKSKEILRRILFSLVGGVVGWLVNWLLNFIPWFHEKGSSWWESIILGMIIYFVIYPISLKEAAKRERRRREKEETNS
jgi:H+/Cl- antiporter ClcA